MTQMYRTKDVLLDLKSTIDAEPEDTKAVLSLAYQAVSYQVPSSYLGQLELQAFLVATSMLRRLHDRDVVGVMEFRVASDARRLVIDWGHKHGCMFEFDYA